MGLSMKILHTVEFYHPSVGGMQEVVRQLSERLVKLGHEVTVATTKLPERKEDILNDVRIVEFTISGNIARGLKGEVERYKDFLLNSEFDVITNFAAQQWATDIMLLILDRVKTKKVIVPTGFSGLFLPMYKDYFELMKSWLKGYDKAVFLSDDYRDINFAREAGVDNTVLIPNGAAEDEFGRDSGVDIRGALDVPKEHFLILHVGSHTGIKGHAEAFRIFKSAGIKNSTFLLVANDFGGGCATKCKVTSMLHNRSRSSKHAGKRIILRELSREETLAAYHEADLFLFPSNIECSPLVLFEAMASKTAFLTTDVGNAKEIIKWSGGGKLLPTDEEGNGYVRARIPESARIVEEVYNSQSLRDELAQAGHRAWQDRFTWERIALHYEALYKGLVNG